MQLRTAARSSHADGFSLIELMVVVAIATILFAVAVPSYMLYVRQSRRTEARTAVLDLAGREERFFSTNGATYTAVPGNLGYTAFGQCHRGSPRLYGDRHPGRRPEPGQRRAVHLVLSGLRGTAVRERCGRRCGCDAVLLGQLVHNNPSDTLRY
jgi:prepilin-type N-terminal cleavage/methylation domain-containing protein